MRAQLFAIAFVAGAFPALAAEAPVWKVGVFNLQTDENGVSDDGASALEDAYADYFTRAALKSGLISIKADGDAYVVTFDVQKALAASKAPAGALEIAPFSYRLKPEGKGGWSWSATSFPHIAFKDETSKTPSRGAFDFNGFALAGTYDPSADAFLSMKMSLDALKGEVTQPDSGGDSKARFLESGIKAEARAKNGEKGGMDFAIAHTFAKLSQVVTQPGGLEVTSTADGAEGGATIHGLRGQEIGALWRAFVAAANANKEPEALADLVKAALPLWNEMGFDVRAKALKVNSPLGSAAIERIGEVMKLSGLTDDGRIELGFDIDGLKLNSPMAPAWTAKLTPMSAKFGMAVTDKGIGEAARLALADPKFGKSGDLSPETQAAMEKAVKAGDPKLIVPPGHLKTPIVDLAFEGSARIDAVAAAELKISADSLDKVMALASELSAASPDLQSAVLGLGLVKGLAKTTADGRLFWDVVVEGDKVTINGQPMPTGK